jgi:hypothetical protein
MPQSLKYLDPIAAVTQPREDFIRFLLTDYPIKDQKLRQALKQQLEQPGTVWQHPYLEGSQPYEAGISINTLIEQKILHPDMAMLFTPSSRQLYKHQQNAVQAVLQQQQNIVVATGTGSGKTECFLIPMMNMLLEEEEKISSPGIRVLIMYPMNALVNDQVKRLRQILCRQEEGKAPIRFGFYTSRTEKETSKALEILINELKTYEESELRNLFSEEEKKGLPDDFDRLIDRAAIKIQRVQAISREEIWEKPPHILVTNYSMLEHMLIRPKERNTIFDCSVKTFRLLVADEAHTYDGSIGTEVSMLLKRFKVALKKSEGEVRCIATSASLGGKAEDEKVLSFAKGLFDETFSQVVRGDRQTSVDRLGQPYTLPADWNNEDLLEYLSAFQLPSPNAALSEWLSELAYVVPPSELQKAESKANGDFHKLLWFALKCHPLVHRLINGLKKAPQPWEQVVLSQELWQADLPIGLDGSPDAKSIETRRLALARLLQLGTLAKENPDDLPLTPVRLHLLFRSLEGVYSCVNSNCRELYLNEKSTCDRCTAPVLELGSCDRCGQVYAFTMLDVINKQIQPLPRSNRNIQNNPNIYTVSLNPVDSVTEDEQNDLEEDSSDKTGDKTRGTFSLLKSGDGWIGSPSTNSFKACPESEDEFRLEWHRNKDVKFPDGCYLKRCAACGSGNKRVQVINRFISYTDAPLSAMIDTLFNLLPESASAENKASKRKLLTFSDGRQDAAFFASDYHRNALSTNDLASISRVTRCKWF